MTKLNNSTRVQAPTNISSCVNANQSRKSCDYYDVLPSNPYGRGLTDRKDKEKNKPGKFAKAKKPFQIGVINVRTIKCEHKQVELSTITANANIGILRIVDRKILHLQEEVRFTKLQEFELVTTSAWTNRSYAACGGVELLLSKKPSVHLKKSSQ